VFGSKAGGNPAPRRSAETRTPRLYIEILPTPAFRSFVEGRGDLRYAVDREAGAGISSAAEEHSPRPSPSASMASITPCGDDVEMTRVVRAKILDAALLRELLGDQVSRRLLSGTSLRCNRLLAESTRMRHELERSKMLRCTSSKPGRRLDASSLRGAQRSGSGVVLASREASSSTLAR